jgi:diketogulonate reductase-like aldo/keto reductase
MNTVFLPEGEAVPALGLGTWRLGEDPGQRGDEMSAVRAAFGLGYRLIDTAEMYGNGGAEEIVGQAMAAAIAGRAIRREQVFIVTKVSPHNASRRGVVEACARSLKRLRLDCIDLYLLHWRGGHPLRETVAAFEQLRAEGKIRHWGVSNFDRADIDELFSIPDGVRCAANQVYYSVSARGIEFDLLPRLRQQRIPTMAYSPIDHGALARDTTLASIGARHQATAAQVALAWVLRQPDVMAIPKAGRAAHLRDNLAAASLVLTAEDLDQINRRFPAPKRRTPLAMT